MATHMPTAFDPGRWLGALTEIGGGYALMADRRIAFLVDDCDGGALSNVMAQVIGQPSRLEAVRSIIERRQNGEAL